MGICQCQQEPNHIITTQYIETRKTKQNDQSSIKTKQNSNYLSSNKFTSSTSTVNCIKLNSNMFQLSKEEDKNSFHSCEDNSFYLKYKSRPILNKLIHKNGSTSSLLKI